MARSDGMSGVGTTIGHSTVDAGSFTTLAEVKNIGGPNPTVNKVDLTHLTSDDETEESTAGLIVPGVVDFVLNFTASVYNTLLGFLRLQKDWKITYPSGDYHEFQGYIVGLPMETPAADSTESITVSVSVQITGLPTFTVA